MSDQQALPITLGEPDTRAHLIEMLRVEIERVRAERDQWKERALEAEARLRQEEMWR
jgi:uncharacterized small protein (DUF1192 family)